MISLFAALLATVVTWQFPRTGSCHEGMPFADGKTGVLVWGGDDTVNLTVGRSDLWDHRGGYSWTPEQSYTNIIAAVRMGDNANLRALFKNEPPANWGGRYNPYMLPLGRVVIKFDSMWKLTSGELNTETGIGKLHFLKMESSRGKNPNAVIEIAMAKSGGGLFAMKVPETVKYSVEVIPAMSQPKVRKALAPRGFKDAEIRNVGRIGNVGGGFKWEIPGDRPVNVDWWKNKDNQLLIRTDRADPFAWGGPEPTYERIAAESVAYWKKFWSEGARVKVPDPILQREFDYGLYRFGAMTDPDGIPAGLQGPWLEDDQLVPWNGDYHFNINVQECYSPAYRGGHFENLKPLFKMVLSWREKLRYNAKMFVGIDNGYVLPHSVDDRGVCIGGFWTGTIDHGSTAWVADMMFNYVKYSGDLEFLKNGGYDFMQGAMNVYLAMMEEKDGKLSIPLGPSPEWGSSDVRKAVGRDPSFQLACAHRLARDLIEAASMLRTEAVDPRWIDVEKRLPAYTSSDPEKGIDLFEGQSFVASHRHHSHMAGFYPFDTIDMTKDQRTLERTYHTWILKGTGEWTGWCVPWASILHTHVGNSYAAVRLLQDWDYYFCDPGHGSHHDGFVHGFTTFGRGGFGPIGNVKCHDVMQMDGQCAAASAVMELFVHEVNGKVEFFRGCPPEWEDVSFENIALSDGRRVSGRRLHGLPSITYSK